MTLKGIILKQPVRIQNLLRATPDLLTDLEQLIERAHKEGHEKGWYQTGQFETDEVFESLVVDKLWQKNKHTFLG